MKAERLFHSGEKPLVFTRMEEEYLFNAEETIKKGELRKASELLWGAVTQALKALAAKNGNVISSHRDFFKFVQEVSKETGDESFWNSFLELNTLHKNFYDETIPEENFPMYYEKAYEFLRRIHFIIER